MSISTRMPPPVASRWADLEAIKKAKQQRTRQTLFYTTASILLAALIGVGIWEFCGWYKAHKHQQFINSIKDDPQKIRAASEAKQITDDERNALWRDRGEERMNQMMDTYFTMSFADRAKWMQDRVKEDIARRAAWQQRMAAGGPTSRPWGNGANNGQNQQNAGSQVARYENRDPTRTAQFQQFRADMAATYRQMGMQPPQGRGGGGRGR
jgi:hypothetical protein